MKKYLTILIVALVLLLSLLIGVTLPAQAAAKPGKCTSLHYVRTGDTLRYLSTIYKMDAWFIVQANNNQAQKPNYPIYLGSRLCIPNDPEGKPKKLAGYILDQVPADFYPRLLGRTITITAYGFGRSSTWIVKVDDKKYKPLFKPRVKGRYEQKYQVPVTSKLVCLKNITTDFQVCRKVIK